MGRISILISITTVVSILAFTSAAQAQSASEGGAWFVFLGESRPVFLSLDLRVQNRSFSVVRDQFIKRLYAALDRDGDGKLSLKEAEQAPWPQLVVSGEVVDFAEPYRVSRVDTSPKDESISLSEFRAYLRERGEPFRVLPPQSAGDREFPLLTQLDSNRDDQLSAREIGTAEHLLAGLDVDEDGMITGAELLPYQNPFVDEQTELPNAEVSYDPSIEPLLLSLVSESDRNDAARRLMERYDAAADQPRDQKLDPRELSLDRTEFDPFDTDENGVLDPEELQTLLEKPPSALHMVVHLDTPPGNAPRVEVSGGKDPPVQRKGKIGKPDEMLLANLDGARIELRVANTEAQTRQLRNELSVQFRNADRNNNGYVEPSEARANPIIEPLFEIMDADGDEKLFKKEMLAYLQVQIDSAAARVEVAITDRGRSLFDLLDADSDQRLGLRELRRGNKLLATLDQNGDGVLTSNEVAHRFEWKIRRGQVTLPANFPLPVAQGGGSQARSTRRPAGPGWFRKMDRNADGDVSVQEFLGTREQFSKIDADRDGLIDPTEAAATR